MKNYLILLFIGFTIVGCIPNGQISDKTVYLTTEYIHVNENGHEYLNEISKFEFEGHKYIRFGDGDFQTIVHDPNCQCNKKDNSSLFDW